MDVPTAVPDAGATSSLRRAVREHPVVAFLILTYALGGSIHIAVYALGLPVRLGSSLSAIFGLALAALMVTAATSGEAGVRALLHRCPRWRVTLAWYGLALLGLLIATLLGASLAQGAAPLEALREKWPLVFTMFLPEILIAVVLIQLFEEVAWTGFMQETLQERHGPLLSCMLVAPAFALAHLVANILEAPEITTALVLLAVQVIVAVFFRVVIVWLYNGSGGSLLIVALFHSAFNALTGSGGIQFTHQLIAGPEAAWLPLASLTVIAVLVVLLTRGQLGYKPKRAAPGPSHSVRMTASRLRYSPADGKSGA